MKTYVATRKGVVVLKPTTSGWDVERTHFDGVRATYIAIDKAKNWVWAGLNHGHWGPKLHVSKNKGKTFEEVGIPKFPEGSKETLKEFWAFARDSKGRVYIGTDPANIFYSDDDGKTWTLNEHFNKIDGRDKWFGGGTDGHCLHSILIDPRNDNHIVVGISVGGTIETKDRGKTWNYCNSGLKANFMPDPNDPIVQDPHLIERSKSNPDILWQQNHCGIFKSEDAGKTWADLSKAKGLTSAFGWAIEIDEKDANTAYTIPALSDETRVPVKGKLVVQKTTNGGKSWKVLNKGLPQKHCYDIIYRHAFSKQQKHMVFGSATGHIYFSKNSGDSWKPLKYQLAPIYSLKMSL